MLLRKSDSLLALIDVQEKLVPLILNNESLVARCEWLLKLANRLQVPILTSEQYPKGLGTTIETFHPYLVQSGRVAKVSFSCMQEPSYVTLLQEYAKNQLILIGIEAHVCILQTAMELNEAGYEVFVVVDAVSSRNDHDLKYGLKRLKQTGVSLITAEMVFFEWLRQSASPEFKALSKEFLQ